MSEYLIKVSGARMPQNCWGRYVHVAVLEVEAGTKRVSMISDRARGVKRVVKVWRNQNVGRTDKCASKRAYAEAKKLVGNLTYGD